MKAAVDRIRLRVGDVLLVKSIRTRRNIIDLVFKKKQFKTQFQEKLQEKHSQTTLGSGRPRAQALWTIRRRTLGSGQPRAQKIRMY